EPRLVLRSARPCAPAPITIIGEPEDYLAAAIAEVTCPLDAHPAALDGPSATLRDRRGGGIAGTIADLVCSGEPVLVVAADARLRARHLQPILGGFELCSHEALRRDPSLAGPLVHVVAIDPPAGAPAELRAYGRFVHLAW